MSLRAHWPLQTLTRRSPPNPRRRWMANSRLPSDAWRGRMVAPASAGQPARRTAVQLRRRLELSPPEPAALEGRTAVFMAPPFAPGVGAFARLGGRLTDRPQRGNFTSSSPAARPGDAAGRGSPIRPARVRPAALEGVARPAAPRPRVPRALSGPRRRPRRPGRPRPPRRALRTSPLVAGGPDGRRPGPAAAAAEAARGPAPDAERRSVRPGYPVPSVRWLTASAAVRIGLYPRLPLGASGALV